MRALDPERRYAALVCFLTRNFRDTMDFLVDMYDKLINRIYNHAQNDLDKHNKAQRKRIRESLSTFKTLAEVVLDESVADSAIREILFEKIEKGILFAQIEEVSTWLTGKYSHVFNLVKERFGYIRQFSPALLKHIELRCERGTNSSLLQAVQILREMNEINKRKLPDDAPLDFMPKKIRPLVEIDGKVNKPAWECALLTAIRDEIKSGNFSVKKSKRFGRFEDFFIPIEKWNQMREGFFRRAGLPSDPSRVEAYLKKWLNLSFDQFLERLPNNTYATIEEDGWRLSSDSAEKLDKEAEVRLSALRNGFLSTWG